MIGVHKTRGIDCLWLDVRFLRIDGKVKILSVTYCSKDVISDYGEAFFNRVREEILAARYR